MYSELVEVYEALYSTTKRLEKEKILAEFLRKLKEKGESGWIYLLRGKTFADYDDREFGVSGKLAMKAIGKSFGVSEDELSKTYRKIGDVGEIAEKFAARKKQRNLFSKKLSIEKVFDNLRKLVEMEGKGAVGRKLDLVSELLGNASDKEAKYIVRTLIGQLRVGIADAILRDAIAEAFFAEEKKEMSKIIETAFDMCNDFAAVFDAASGGRKSLDKIKVALGRPMNVMLPVKVESVEEAFRICGKPAAIEHKYDGFRVVISKQGDEIKLFTRRLEEVTKQFPDVVKIVREHVKGREFILDSEVVGYNPKTKQYRPFEAISQRIRRKYDIEKLESELPVEVNIFDVIYHDGKSYLEETFRERRKLIEKIVKGVVWKIRVAKQIVTDSEEEAMKFYKEAIKLGEEGIMVKNLDAPYQQGRRVGYMVKMKPQSADLDLVIIGAEYGSGKRAGRLTSYILGVRKENEFVAVGKASSGLKEKPSVSINSPKLGQVKELEQEGGVTYDDMTNLLKPLIVSESGKTVKVKPKVVVSVIYQNIQKSPSYDSGFAMRFPRITNYRPDRGTKDIATIEDIEREWKRMMKGMSHLG